MANSSIQQQRDYVADLKRKGFKFGLTVGEAFIRGIRDIGYKSSATALDEQIDNSYEAGASTVHVVFGFERTSSEKKPSEIAVIDNGHGMEGDMIRAAVTWGGTHRENQRTGFGRYGYGLPSSAMGIGRRYTVYSKVAGGEVHAVTIDLDDISAGKYTQGGDIVVPEAKPSKLPKFVERHLEGQWPFKSWTNGTIVVIEKLDKLTWKTAGALQENLLRHFGVVYHKLRADLDIQVNEKKVEPIDPLFLTDGYRWYDLDADRAEAYDPIEIEVKDPETREVVGTISVRLSYLPPGFASIDKKRGADGKNANERFAILKDYNGFIFARMGRVIDVVTRSPLTTFVNYDRYIKIEIDFPAALDEEFNVTTSKQQIVPSDRIWQILKESGLLKALEQLRKKFKEESKLLRNRREQDPEGKRASEEAMERASLLNSRKRPDVQAKQEERGEKGLEQEAERRSKETGRPVEAERKELELELKGRPYKVAQESMPGLPFFRMSMVGGTKVLWLNTATRFYQDVYMGPESTVAVRSALELLLFSIGDRMLDAHDDLQDIYVHELPQWSAKMEYALAQLSKGIGNGEPEDEDEPEADDGAQASEPALA
jgi:hypothetical protein